MATMGLAGVRRGKTTVTTVSNPKAPCPLDKVNREFRVERPNALGGRFHHVHTWAGFGLRGVRDRRLCSPDCGLEGQHFGHRQLCSGCSGAGNPCPQAGAGRWPDPPQRQGRSIPGHELHPRLVEPTSCHRSAASAKRQRIAEIINGLYKTEVIRRQRSWPSVSAPGGDPALGR